MINFCTLFDSTYLSRALALINTLEKNKVDYHLYILAFDDLVFEIFNRVIKHNCTLISLKEFEDIFLLEVKKNRTRGEYCWTCTPSIIKYCIEKYNLDSCTYLDADLFFFNSPKFLIDEIPENKSVLITEHRYTPKYDQSGTSGKYCVQFMTFKNTPDGMAVLNWWRERCLEWCYARHEDGKFGDQKYLDDWMTRFDCVHELKHLGGGVAPWNMTQYQYKKVGDEVLLSKDNVEYPLVFFHFHALKIYDYKYDLGVYDLNEDIVNLIYKPYLLELEKIDLKLKEIGLDFNWHAKKPFDRSFRGHLSRLKRMIKRNLNIYTKNELGING